MFVEKVTYFKRKMKHGANFQKRDCKDERDVV